MKGPNGMLTMDNMRPAAIKKLRLSLGMSQAEFAAHIGLKTRGAVCALESGKHFPKGPLLKLLEILGAQQHKAK